MKSKSWRVEALVSRYQGSLPSFVHVISFPENNKTGAVMYADDIKDGFELESSETHVVWVRPHAILVQLRED